MIFIFNRGWIKLFLELIIEMDERLHGMDPIAFWQEAQNMKMKLSSEA